MFERRMKRLAAVTVAALLATTLVIAYDQTRDDTPDVQVDTECMDDTATVLADQPIECRPDGELTGKIGAPPPPNLLCPADECSIYIWGKHGIGYQDLWTYPVRTVAFYGYNCYAELNRAPQGKPGSDAFGLFDSYGQGAMTHKPTIWLTWCTQNGLVRSAATVACVGTPVYPYYFNNSSCAWSITPGFKPTRTVGAGWTFTGVAGSETVGLMATIVAGTNGGRDVLIQGWRWSL